MTEQMAARTVYGRFVNWKGGEDSMQPISGDSEDNDVAAMLEDITKEGYMGTPLQSEVWQRCGDPDVFPKPV